MCVNGILDRSCVSCMELCDTPGLSRYVKVWGLPHCADAARCFPVNGNNQSQEYASASAQPEVCCASGPRCCTLFSDSPLCQGVQLELYSSTAFAVQPEYEESSPTEEELLELQEQNFRLMQQQQQLEMEAAAQQELAAQAQPVGLRERIGFVGAGQARRTGARPILTSSMFGRMFAVIDAMERVHCACKLLSGQR